MAKLLRRCPLLRSFTTRHQPNLSKSDLLLIDLRTSIDKNRFVHSLNITKTLIEAHHKSPFDILHSLSNYGPFIASMAAEVLVTACSDLGRPDDALRLIAGLPRFSSILSLNRLLQSLISARRFKDALRLFHRIRNSGGIRPDNTAYYKAIEAAVKSKDMDRAFQLKEELESKLGIEPAHSFPYNMLISGLWKAGRGDDAKNLYIEMEQKKVTPTVVTFNAMMSGYQKMGDSKGVNEFFQKMQDQGHIIWCTAGVSSEKF